MIFISLFAIPSSTIALDRMGKQTGKMFLELQLRIKDKDVFIWSDISIQEVHRIPFKDTFSDILHYFHKTVGKALNIKPPQQVSHSHLWYKEKS